MQARASRQRCCCEGVERKTSRSGVPPPPCASSPDATTRTPFRWRISGESLSLNVRAAQFRPNDKADNKADDKAPDFRIFAGQTEFGAAWRKTFRENREHLSVKLDDPSFVAPIYASLVEGEDGHSLIWARCRIAD